MLPLDAASETEVAPHTPESLLLQFVKQERPVLINFVIGLPRAMRNLDEIMAEEVNANIARIANVGKLDVGFSCTWFSTQLFLLWPGYKTPDEMVQNPISSKSFQRPDLSDHMVHQYAMYDGIQSTLGLLKLLDSDFSGEEKSRGIVVMLTGGVSTHDTEESKAVAGMLDYANSNTKDRITPFIRYFKQCEGLREADFEELARSTKFNPLGYVDLDPKEPTQHEKQYRFLKAIGLK